MQLSLTSYAIDSCQPAPIGGEKLQQVMATTQNRDCACSMFMPCMFSKHTILQPRTPASSLNDFVKNPRHKLDIGNN
jgi:hypothetical protein